MTYGTIKFVFGFSDCSLCDNDRLFPFYWCFSYFFSLPKVIYLVNEIYLIELSKLITVGSVFSLYTIIF